MDFKPYYNNWLDISELFKIERNKKINFLPVNLNIDFFKSLSFDDNSLRKYRINAVSRASEILGNNPALCFSGGVDSQAMLHCWLESGIKFDAFILVFEHDLNAMDFELARKICNNYGIELKEIKLDVVKFLNFYNYEYSIKYNSVSPHFNVHYKLFDTLKNMGYTGVCAGGDIPYLNMYDNSWGCNFGKNSNNFYQYVKASNYACIGNFLSYSPELAWVTALMTLPVYWPTHSIYSVSNCNMETFIASSTIAFDNLNLTNKQKYLENEETQRYLNKCKGYEKSGMKIIAQSQKYTGFEEVKKYLENVTGDGWTFEKRYRYPLEQKHNHSWIDSYFTFIDDNTKEFVNFIYAEINKC